MSVPIEQYLNAVVETLAVISFDSHVESDMQRAIADHLHWASIVFGREHRFNARDRVDFFLPDEGIAIECKVSGGSAEMIRQLDRYARQESVRGLILVTTKVQHRAMLPPTLQEKPTRAVVFHRLP